MKKRKTWLWVLGWLLCFPIPLTIIMLRNKKLSSTVKYVIIGVAWAVYVLMLAVGGCNGKSDTNAEEPVTQEQSTQEVEAEDEELVTEEPVAEEPAPEEDVVEESPSVGKVYELRGDSLGDYGRVVTLNAETDMPVDKHLYKLPAGSYRVTTTNEKMSSFYIVKDEITTEEGNEEYPEILDYVSAQGVLLTAGDNDFNGNAVKEAFIELADDESIQIPDNDNGTIIFEEIIE